MCRGGNPRVGLHGAQRGEELMLDAIERCLRMTLEAQHENGRRVGCAGEAEAVVVLGAEAVDRDQLTRGGERCRREELVDDALRLAFGARHVQLGRREARRQGVEDDAVDREVSARTWLFWFYPPLFFAPELFIAFDSPILAMGIYAVLLVVLKDEAEVRRLVRLADLDPMAVAA